MAKSKRKTNGKTNVNYLKNFAYSMLTEYDLALIEIVNQYGGWYNAHAHYDRAGT